MKYLCEKGHPSYKFYKQRCLAEDPMGSKLIFPETEEENVNLDEYLNKIKSIEQFDSTA